MRYRITLLVAVLLLFPPVARAQQKLPPSTLQYPLVWEFQTPPPRATPAAGSACETANQYVNLIGAKRGREVPELFAEDGVFLFQGRLRRGRKEIHGFYDTVNVRGAIPVSFTDKGAECFMELANLSGGDDTWRLTAIDHFTVTPNRQIARLVIWAYTPPATPPASSRPAATR